MNLASTSYNVKFYKRISISKSRCGTNKFQFASVNAVETFQLHTKGNSFKS